MSEDYEGTIKSKEDFDPETSARQFKKAMKGIGTDELAIIRILVSHDSLQREEIKQKYKEMYGQDLIEDLREELGGHFEDAVVAMLTAPTDLLTTSLHQALSAVGTDEKTLTDILCFRNADEIESMKYYYESTYKQSLDDALESELSGPFRNLMRGLVAAGRDDDDEPVDAAKARKDAQDLYDAGVGMNNDTDESEFIRILNTRNYAQLQETFKEYENIAQDSIENAIEAEFSGDMKNGLLAIVQRVKDPLGFYATRLNQAMAGAGTDDKSLIRILVSRAEKDLASIRSKYKELFNTDLADDIKDDTGGDYGKLLIAIVNGK